ncbi:MAG: hypothetical protein K6T66_05635 [Peptococcaceae bacterium]|nr:hypothetical protein [Peptococcaceae bacterium]
MLAMIAGAGYLRPNYRGETIPSGAGVAIYVSTLAAVSASFFFLPPEIRQKSAVFMILMSGCTLLGLVDDFWGSGRCRGLAGHLKSLLAGRLTTGSLKALAGLVLAFYASALSGPWTLIPLNTLIIALSVNMINLLDLRPGRAGKSFLALGILILAAFPLKYELIFLSAAAGSLLAYLPADLKARAMMGDAGANALGAVTGITAVWLFGIEAKVFCLLALLLLHAVAEKHSLTGIIASNRVLDYLDRLGANRPEAVLKGRETGKRT